MTSDIYLLMGSAGSGKGTQAERLIAQYGFAYVESGGLIRAKSKEDSPLGRRIKFNDDKGKHAPDTVITALLIDFLSALEEQHAGEKKPLLIDGFPRTMPQVDMLDQVLKYFDRDASKLKALWIKVPVDIAEARLLNRAVCNSCKKVFPSREVTTCDNCGGVVAPRVYDTVEGIRDRLSFFPKHTMPVIERYRKEGRLVEIDGLGAVDDVWKRVQSAVQ